MDLIKQECQEDVWCASAGQHIRVRGTDKLNDRWTNDEVTPTCQPTYAGKTVKVPTIACCIITTNEN